MTVEQTSDTSTEMIAELSPDFPTTTRNVDIVPDSLLSLAKDVRYIQHCQTLLNHVIEPLLPRFYNTQSTSRIENSTWFLSSLLYLFLIVLPTGRTLGMEACGLTFAQNQTKRGRAVVVGALLLSTCWVYGLQLLSTMQDSNLTMIDNSSPDDRVIRNREALHGSERRRLHESLRQQMLQRNNVTSSTATTTTTTGAHTISSGQPVCSQVAPVSSYSFKRRIFSLLIKCAKSMGEALSTNQFEGPHAVRNATEATRVSPSNLTIAMWIIRLHLAQYCITGRYPTWFHRFAGLQLERRDVRISHPSNTHRVVGMLIGVQAVACLIRYVGNVTTNWTADYLEKRASKTSKALTSTSQSTISSLFHSTRDETNEGRLENVKSSTGDGTKAICAICRLERSYPAAPSSCGHVFCWNCLIQWVSTVRAECPLCRSPCRPQDMIALHNYTIS